MKRCLRAQSSSTERCRGRRQAAGATRRRDGHKSGRGRGTKPQLQRRRDLKCAAARRRCGQSITAGSVEPQGSWRERTRYVESSISKSTTGRRGIGSVCARQGGSLSPASSKGARLGSGGRPCRAPKKRRGVERQGRRRAPTACRLVSDSNEAWRCERQWCERIARGGGELGWHAAGSAWSAR